MRPNTKSSFTELMAIPDPLLVSRTDDGGIFILEGIVMKSPPSSNKFPCSTDPLPSSIFTYESRTSAHMRSWASESKAHHSQSSIFGPQDRTNFIFDFRLRYAEDRTEWEAVPWKIGVLFAFLMGFFVLPVPNDDDFFVIFGFWSWKVEEPPIFHFPGWKIE